MAAAINSSYDYRQDPVDQRLSTYRPYNHRYAVTIAVEFDKTGHDQNALSLPCLAVADRDDHQPDQAQTAVDRATIEHAIAVAIEMPTSVLGSKVPTWV